MIFLHIVLAIIALSFSGAFIVSHFDRRVSEESTIGLGFFTALTVAIFILSFLK